MLTCCNRTATLSCCLPLMSFPGVWHSLLMYLPMLVYCCTMAHSYSVTTGNTGFFLLPSRCDFDYLHTENIDFNYVNALKQSIFKLSIMHEQHKVMVILVCVHWSRNISKQAIKKNCRLTEKIPDIWNKKYPVLLFKLQILKISRLFYIYHHAWNIWIFTFLFKFLTLLSLLPSSVFPCILSSPLPLN